MKETIRHIKNILSLLPDSVKGEMTGGVKTDSLLRVDIHIPVDKAQQMGELNFPAGPEMVCKDFRYIDHKIAALESARRVAETLVVDVDNFKEVELHLSLEGCVVYAVCLNPE